MIGWTIIIRRKINIIKKICTDILNIYLIPLAERVKKYAYGLEDFSAIVINVIILPFYFIVIKSNFI